MKEIINLNLYEPMKEKYHKILVTGGAGFIGSFLCEKLLKQGHKVICLDNYFTGRKENISHLLSNPRFEIIRHDIVQPISLEVDQIYNLACPASPVHYQFDPVKTTKVSVMGAINMLEIAKNSGARILQASTSEIYGNPNKNPQSENYNGNVNPIGPRSCYDEGKRVAETLFFDYKRQYDTDVKIIRIFNTYGPRMLPNDGRVISNFIVQALLGKNITIYGDGSQTRSFCFVSDLVDGIIMMMNKNNFTGPVNLGNPNEITILELAKRIILLLNSKSKIEYRDLPTGDPAIRNPNISKAKKELNWNPKVKLDDGLKKVINYFKNELAKNYLEI
ncbi:MAG: UDP-glucuronic acid decarboxylase family protein [Candidatus Marinimicrobia bacterium]|nr:UDP-glucuronic acid decarboxylase family protein [Candidatus Neomarinimicrobiota bacterium]